MRGGSPRTRGTAGWRKDALDLAKAGALLRETGCIPSDRDPISATGHWDTRGRPRLVKAKYPDGWSVTMWLRLDGSYSLDVSKKLIAMKGPKA